eukprot:gene7639-15636_t
MEHDENVSSSCCGTNEGSLIWWNSANKFSIVLSAAVWFTILYSASVTIIIILEGEYTLANGTAIIFLCFMALLSHLMTMCVDPGSVPMNAHPLPKDVRAGIPISMCGTCDAFKPFGSHHDRISNRCISRMDHFCPWMNNAIGANNQKNFFLFLIYTDAAALYMLILLIIHLVDCEALHCQTFSDLTLNLVRALVFVLLFAVLFTTAMLCNQIYGLMVGLGTIDRMKNKKGHKKVGISVPFAHVFGSQWWFYLLPFPPVFHNPEEVLGYPSSLQHLAEVGHYNVGVTSYYHASRWCIPYLRNLGPIAKFYIFRFYQESSKPH